MKRVSKFISALLAVLVFSATSLPAFATETVSLETGSLVLSSTEYTYTGKSIEPSFKVVLGDITVPKKYLNVEYSSNVNTGTGTVTVTGVDKYEGTLTQSFAIKPLNITSKSISKSITKTVVNKTPTVKLTLNGKTLVKDKDYKVSFSNISKTGVKTGKIKLTGLGNFTSSKTYSINVYPKKISGINNVKRENTAITFRWSSQEAYDVTGYKVYSCDANGDNRKHLKTVSENQVKITGLDAGKYYYFVVRAYKVSGDTILYGDYSNVYKTCSMPKKVVMNSACPTSDNKYVVAKWSKVPSSGYEVKYSTDPTFKTNTKVVTLKDSSSISYKFKASSKKTYYVKVRAFRKYDGKTVYGKWSDKISNKFSNLYSTYSSNYVNNKDRTTNLRIASETISGTILQPGETFSFNKVVGKRTSAKGYKEAHIFTGSQGTAMGLGGGVCQVASTMFNATLLANLSIVERHQHSQRVSYVPLGRDAAIYWGSEDYRFKNNTNYPIKIVMTVKNGKITCSMYTSQNVKPKKVSLKVTRRGNNFTLKRYVGGKCNYTAKSTY